MKLENILNGLVKVAFIINLITISIYAGQGVIDTSFGINGVKDTTFANPNFIADTVVSGNKIWFTGIANFDPRNHVIYGRFSLDGTLDFSNIVRPCNADPNNLQDSTSTANKISLQPDGKLLVTGKCGAFNAANFANPFVLRINTNGTLDSSFGIGGIALFDLRSINPQCGANQTTYDVAVAPDGNIIAVGGDGNTIGSPCSSNIFPAAIVLKISPAGSLLTPTYFPQPGAAGIRFQGLTIQPDGKILVGYNDDTATAGVYQIRRYNSDFTPDTSFGTNGTATFPVGTGDPRGNVTSIHLESSGKIVVIGYVAPNNAQPSIARFLPNGTLDTTFNGTGRLRFPDDQNVNMLVTKIFRQPDGRYLISGAISVGWGGYRVNPNGTIDSTYGNRTAPGIAWFNPPTGKATGVPAILPDGSMIQIGYATAVQSSVTRLVKINQNQNRNANLFDFDSDGKSDISVFRPANTVWYASKSSDNQVQTAQWGIATDKIVPADYNGDGKTDFAVFRMGFWFILLNGGGFEGFQWGSAGDIPFPADFDGDSKADLAVFRNGTWFVRRSSGGTITQNWGSAGDIPVVGDYDADGRADFAVYRNGIWFVLNSNGGNTAIQWGIGGDKTVQGDYNGDGKTDFAVFRDGFWYVLLNGGGFVGAQWGAAGDVAAPADFDGDGRTDLAVFRNGTWFIQRTTAGVQVVNFGSAGDVAIPSAFVQ